VLSSLFLEPGLTWHRYFSSDSFGGGEDVPCPVEGCPPSRRDGITLVGAELGAGYRELEAENPVYPATGVGLYRAAVGDSSKTLLGANIGLVIQFRRSGRGPALDVRYFRIFGHSRFKSLLPFSLRWSF
jgi:hypothetical protein